MFDRKTVRDNRCRRITSDATNTAASSSSVITEPGASFDWELETAVTTIPTPFSMVCYRPFTGPISTSPLVMNELYLPIDLASAHFLTTTHQKFTVQFERIAREYIADGRHLALSTTAYTELLNLCMQYVTSFSADLNTDHKRSQVLEIHGAETYRINLDAAHQALHYHFLNTYREACNVIYRQPISLTRERISSLTF